MSMVEREICFFAARDAAFCQARKTLAEEKYFYERTEAIMRLFSLRGLRLLRFEGLIENRSIGIKQGLDDFFFIL
jgi:hypothetical protein